VKLTPAGKLGVQSIGKGKGRALDDDDSMKDSTKSCVIESSGSFISVLHTFKNIAPIMDAALVDIDGSGEVCPISGCRPYNKFTLLSL
jgi:DNA damage-binding protein 1